MNRSASLRIVGSSDFGRLGSGSIELSEVSMAIPPSRDAKLSFGGG